MTQKGSEYIEDSYGKFIAQAPSGRIEIQSSRFFSIICWILGEGCRITAGCEQPAAGIVTKTLGNWRACRIKNTERRGLL